MVFRPCRSASDAAAAAETQAADQDPLGPQDRQPRLRQVRHAAQDPFATLAKACDMKAELMVIIAGGMSYEKAGAKFGLTRGMVAI